MERLGQGGGEGAQGFISGGMLPVSKDIHFTRSQRPKGGAPPPQPHHGSPACILDHTGFPVLQQLSILPPLTPSPSSSSLSTIPTLSPKPKIPPSPHVAPHLMVSCMFPILFFFFPRTKHYQNRVQNGFFFFWEGGSVSVCEVTYSDKAPGRKGGGWWWWCCHRP